MITYQNTVEKWDVFEASIHGKTEGNPFTDYTVRAVFSGECETVKADGFYDGDGVYRVRFMPSFEGKYTFRVEGDFSDADTAYTGEFQVVPPQKDNHGPVRTANTYHFAYEDGTPYYPVGTTCYVWELQSDERIAETLESLREAAFNKIRFCIFPKHYDYNLGEPRSYPYEGTPMDSSVLTKQNFLEYTGKTEGNHWDFTRFRPEHFRHIEACILELQRLGIEADIIVMHPYDRWGFAQMTKEQDDLYWRYVLARLSAYRNVWWSLANEYDLLEHKTTADWERYAKLICEHDPYRHLRSIHNCRPFYDHTRPWITHCSIQRQDLYKSSELVNEWRALSEACGARRDRLRGGYSARLGQHYRGRAGAQVLGGRFKGRLPGTRRDVPLPGGRAVVVARRKAKGRELEARQVPAGHFKGDARHRACAESGGVGRGLRGPGGRRACAENGLPSVLLQLHAPVVQGILL